VRRGARQGTGFAASYFRKPGYFATAGGVRPPVADPEDPDRWASVSGLASLVDDGADDQIDRLAKKYIGKDTYPFRAPGERRVSVRIAVEKVDGRGPD